MSFNEIKLVPDGDRFELSGALEAVLKSLGGLYIESSDVESASGRVVTLNLPSIGKTLNYGQRLRAVTLRGRYRGDPVRFKIQRNGRVKFSNFWEHENFARLCGELAKAAQHAEPKETPQGKTLEV